MTRRSGAIYRMHDMVQVAYRQVHERFDEDHEWCSYRSMTRKQNGKRVLQRHNRADAAFNFHLYFPTHYFKVRHALESEAVVGLEKFASWLRFNPYLTVIDVGCGDGAGSVAMIEAVLRLRECGDIDPRPTQICCVGLDLNLHTLEIYEMMMGALRDQVGGGGIDLEYSVVPYPINSAHTLVERELKRVRESWQQPALSHSMVVMANVVDMLKEQYDNDQQKTPQTTGGRLRTFAPVPFGDQLASLYRFLFVEVPIDHLHIVTVDTEPDRVQDAVQEMITSIQRDLREREHPVTSSNVPLQRINFENPESGFWRSHRAHAPIRPFLVTVCDIHNRKLGEDQRWEEITAPENIELAWARARHEMTMTRQPFCDEIEIRLFEHNLTANLERLHGELEAYAIHAGYLMESLRYGIPKKPGKVRPRGLTWLEEEILIIAIIQVIGQQAMTQRSCSFAYRLSGENTPERGDTEHLYQRWTEAWEDFRAEIRRYLDDHPNARVFQTDIRAFFERVTQRQLMERMRRGFDLSQRIQWLLELLVSRDVTPSAAGRGLVQGSAGAGFLANVFVSPLDELFSATDAKKRRLFRYVDDTVVVIPDPADEEQTRDLVLDTIRDLDLEPNRDKTQSYSAEEYLPRIADDELLTGLQDRYRDLVLPLLWKASDANLLEQLRSSWQPEEHWWATVRRYRACLTELGLYISLPTLSRYMAVAVQNHDARDSVRKDNNSGLMFPELPFDESIGSTQAWAAEFCEANPDWIERLGALRADLITFFFANYDLCVGVDNSVQDEEQERAGRRLRFVTNRLIYLGLENRVAEGIADLVCERPWVVRDPLWWIEELARQGYEAEVWRIAEHHEQNSHEMSTYLQAVALRAVRFFPGQVRLFEPRLVHRLFVGPSLTRLMATETWLLMAARLPEVPSDEGIVRRIRQILNAVERVENRLLKNYILMLGVLAPNEVPADATWIREDPLLMKAQQIARDGLVSSIFEYIEPTVLRQRYYSAQPPTIEDDGPSSR